MYYVINHKIKEYAAEKYKSDLFLKWINKRITQDPWFASFTLWFTFLPIYKKVHWLSLNKSISFPAYYVPAMPCIAIQSIVLAYIGGKIPDLNYHFWETFMTWYTTPEVVAFSVLLAVLMIMKMTYWGLWLSLRIKKCKRKSKGDDDCISNCSEDAKTCVSLNLTLESISHVKKFIDFDMKQHDH